MPGRDFLTKIAVPSFLSISLLASAAGRASAWQLEHNVPSAVRLGIDQGAADSSDEMNVTVHLKMHDRAAFDAALEQLYNPASSKYHQWMTDAELQKYAPTAAEVAKVRSELEKHGLTVVSADPQGFSIRVHGTVSNVENAFQTHIHQFAMNDKAFRANVQDARLTGDAGNLVTSVSGLSSHAVQPLFKRANDPRTGQPYAPIALSVVNAKGGLGSIVENKCFTDPQTFTYTTPGSKLPVGVYFGNVYDDSTKICDFTPAELQRRYGLDAAHKAGFDGTGQTIALIEGYGYPTMLQDANTFNQLSGLPLFNSSNFEVIYPEGPPKSPVAGIIAGWNVEIALDIQWAHVVAPNAKIIVVAAAGQDIEDLQDALSYAITHKLANSISNSWEDPLVADLIAGPVELASFDAVLSKAAAQGISVQFSSGDGGDGGLGTPIGSPGVPSNSPFATSVGGTAILNNVDGSGFTEVGWGNGTTRIAAGGVLDPPVQNGFFGGAGGGESVQYAKPSFQSALPGTGRQTPDVSMLADPNTGVPLVVTLNGKQVLLAGVGGTSLASPMFSAFWTLANQAAGKPLGQAARRIPALSSGEIIDVLPIFSPTDVSGTIFDSKGATFYSPADLLSQSGFDPTQSLSAILPLDPQNAFVISFGSDTSLTVTKGWDNVTGFGFPNGLAFIHGAAGK